MRGLARELFALCSLMSLLLCATACVLWVRSYSVGDVFWYAKRADTELRLWQRVWRLGNIRGTAEVMVVTGVRPWDPERFSHSAKPQRLEPGFHYNAVEQFNASGDAADQEDSLWAKLGFRAETRTEVDDSKRLVWRTYTFPHWFVAALTAVLPAARFVAWRRRWQARRRHASGLCANCGYDLRFTPERCPECGTPVTPGAASGLPRRVLVFRAAAGLLVVLIAFGSWAHGRWAEWRMSSRLAQGVTPIARFTFDRDDADESGFGASIDRKNAPVEDGALVLNGFYEYGVLSQAAYRASVKVPRLNSESFTVMWRFRCARMMASGRWNLLTGGENARWMVVSRQASGKLNVAFNNGDTASHDVPDIKLKPDVWVQAAVSVNVKERRVLVMLDGRKVADIALPADFVLGINSGSGRDDRAFMFTNYSTGETFGGQIDELTVYSRALSEAELAPFWRPQPGGDN